MSRCTKKSLSCSSLKEVNLRERASNLLQNNAACGLHCSRCKESASASLLLLNQQCWFNSVDASPLRQTELPGAFWDQFSTFLRSPNELQWSSSPGQFGDWISPTDAADCIREGIEKQINIFQIWLNLTKTFEAIISALLKGGLNDYLASRIRFNHDRVSAGSSGCIKGEKGFSF